MNFPQLLANIFFPRQCVSCGKTLDAGVVCEACYRTIPLHATLFCALCKARLPYAAKICHPRADYILGAAGTYRDPTLQALIRDLKFHGIRDAALPLAELLARYLISLFPPSVIPAPYRSTGQAPAGIQNNNFCIIPIPLGKKRERERGFNQAELIAKNLAKNLNLPLVPNVLARIKNTKPQTETKNASERRANIEGCFKVTSPAEIIGKKILHIDDVTTSGSTFAEAARELKIVGAKRIIAIATAMA